MKAFSIAVAVTLVLAFVCVMQSSAIPVVGEPELKEVGNHDTPVVLHQETSMESWMGPAHSRQKRQSHLHMCQICCNCCKRNKGCGFCCKF